MARRRASGRLYQERTANGWELHPSCSQSSAAHRDRAESNFDGSPRKASTTPCIPQLCAVQRNSVERNLDGCLNTARTLQSIRQWSQYSEQYRDSTEGDLDDCRSKASTMPCITLSSLATNSSQSVKTSDFNVDIGESEKSSRRPAMGTLDVSVEVSPLNLGWTTRQNSSRTPQSRRLHERGSRFPKAMLVDDVSVPAEKHSTCPAGTRSTSCSSAKSGDSFTTIRSSSSSSVYKWRKSTKLGPINRSCFVPDEADAINTYCGLDVGSCLSESPQEDCQEQRCEQRLSSQELDKQFDCLMSSVGTEIVEQESWEDFLLHKKEPETEAVFDAADAARALLDDIKGLGGDTQQLDESQIDAELGFYARTLLRDIKNEESHRDDLQGAAHRRPTTKARFSIQTKTDSLTAKADDLLRRINAKDAETYKLRVQ